MKVEPLSSKRSSDADEDRYGCWCEKGVPVGGDRMQSRLCSTDGFLQRIKTSLRLTGRCIGGI